MSAPDINMESVRAWLTSARFGVLSTMHEGAPFGSLVSYALAPSALSTPLLWLSDLAVHTKALLAEPRCSMFVSDPLALGGGGQDPQASWRVTLVGRATRVVAPEDAVLRAAYLGVHPGDPSHGALPGFAIWRIDVEKTRYIAGFGRMGWL